MQEKKERAVQYYVVSDEEISRIIKEASAVASKEAIRVYETEKEKERGKRRDRRLRNTALLLENYRMFKQSVDNSIYSSRQIEESAGDILESMMNIYDDEVIIRSIRRSAEKTSVMVAHIDNMIELYRAYCYHQSGDYIDIRRFEVMYQTYISDKKKSVGELALDYDVSANTIYGDLNEAKRRLGALIFGIDGVAWGI